MLRPFLWLPSECRIHASLILSEVRGLRWFQVVLSITEHRFFRRGELVLKSKVFLDRGRLHGIHWQLILISHVAIQTVIIDLLIVLVDLLGIVFNHFLRVKNLCSIPSLMCGSHYLSLIRTRMQILLIDLIPWINDKIKILLNLLRINYFYRFLNLFRGSHFGWGREFVWTDDYLGSAVSVMRWLSFGNKVGSIFRRGIIGGRDGKGWDNLGRTNME